NDFGPWTAPCPRSTPFRTPQVCRGGGRGGFRPVWVRLAPQSPRFLAPAVCRSECDEVNGAHHALWSVRAMRRTMRGSMNETCATCGAPLPAGARFCMNCGQPVAPVPAADERRRARLQAAAPGNLLDKMRAPRLTGERKTVTALFADV